LEWKLQRSDTLGHYCVMTATMPPGSGVPPHQHPQQEAFFILDGEAEFAVGDNPRWQKVRAGDMVNIPHDAVHGFRNASDRSVSVLLTCEGDLGKFFEEAGVPLAENEAPAHPTPEAIGRVLDIAKKHGQRFPEIALKG
jgi:quercetin dioxygenase-like cupin family protein